MLHKSTFANGVYKLMILVIKLLILVLQNFDELLTLKTIYSPQIQEKTG